MAEALQIISGVAGIVVLIKLIMFIVSRKTWLEVVTRRVYGNPRFSSLIFAVLAAAIFYYLALELSIVQIFAAAAFMACMATLGLLQYSRTVSAFTKQVEKQRFSSIQWILIVVWFVLAGWAIYASFIA